MNTINTGSQEKFLGAFPTVLGASLITIALLQWLPVLSLFFAVPLYIVFFTSEKNTYIFSVFVTFLLDALVSIGTLVLKNVSLSSSLVVTAFLGSAFFILPMLCTVFSTKIRYRYLLGISGFISAVCWAFFFVGTEAGSSILSVIRQLSDESVSLMYTMVPEGFERETFRAQFSSDSLYSMILDTLLYSILPVCIGMYAISFRIAEGISCKILKTKKHVFNVLHFYNDFLLFVPLVCGMSGIITGKLLDNKYVTIVSWNITLAAGLYFTLQGLGIFFFFTQLIRKRKGFNPFFGIFLILILFLLNGWLYFLGSLLIAGVVELFVPLRMRFDNTDTTDPTPGRGSDQT